MSRATRWRVLIVGVIAVVVASAAAVVTISRVPTESRPPAPAEIDRAAEYHVPPATAVIDVRREYGAVGDGIADDTGALQAAMSSAVGPRAGRKTVFLPVGTYRITRPLEWRLPDGTWSSWLRLMGEDRDRTMIRLQDAAPGFGRNAMIVTGSKDARPDGGGNQAFANSITDLTVDVGSGNPEASGIDYLTSNRGVVRNVHLRSGSPDSGATGILMQREYPGPGLIQDVRITGFDTGISIARYEYSMTVERLRLDGQRRVGVENLNNVLTIRDLVSHNAVTAVANGHSGTTASMLVLVDAELRGSAGGTAVRSSGVAHLRRIRTTGYDVAIEDRGTPVPLAPEATWTSPGATTESSPPLDLEVEEPPVESEPPDARTVNVRDVGARGDGRSDDTAAIQAAFDSAQTVQFGGGVFRVTRPIEVPESVTAIAGFDSLLRGRDGAFRDGSTEPMFRIRGDAPGSLTIGQLVFDASKSVVDVERAGTRTVHLQDIHASGVPFRGGPGRLYLTNVEGGEGWTFSPGQQVWARQFNVERVNGKLVNNGAQLWILGLKTEGPDTVLVNRAGATTEIVGGLLFPVAPVSRSTPAFVNENARLDVSLAESANDPTRAHEVLIASSSGAGLSASAFPARGGGGFSVGLAGDQGG